jgi:hypothetical protein
MNATLAEYIAWRRRNVRHQYVGRLEAVSDRIRFVGRAPELGIDVALSIPLEQIEGVRYAESSAEQVLGERGVVLELTGTEPIYVRELGQSTNPARLLHLIEQTLNDVRLQAAGA